MRWRRFWRRRARLASVPIGVIEQVRHYDNGLSMRVRLDDSPLAQEVQAQIRR